MLFDSRPALGYSKNSAKSTRRSLGIISQHGIFNESLI
jgi:hypothetical protein